MSIGVIAKLFVKADKEKEFEGVFTKLQAAVNSNEAGCEFYKLYKNNDEANTYIVLESYSDQSALEAHQKTDHYKTFGAELAPFMSSPPELTIMPSMG